MLQKRERQQMIRSLIQRRPIGTQEDLRSLLQKAGVAATQSSVSRDLEELGIVKQQGHYTLPRPGNNGAARGLLSVDQAGENLIIARTLPGLASAVAVEIDGADLEEIVGTIAGEDTIFIAVREQKSQRTAMRRILDLFA